MLQRSQPDLPLGLCPSQDLWFNDGNLILHAGPVAFRVYRGLLCAQSTFFYDLFSLPLDLKDGLEYKGHPIIELYDTPEELSHFLRAMIDARYFEPPPRQYSVETIAAILRLSTKYDVSYLRRRAFRQMQRLVPKSLAQWRNHMEEFSYLSINKKGHTLLNLAKEFDSAWLIPYLFTYAILYEILRQDMIAAGLGDVTRPTKTKEPSITNEQLLEKEDAWGMGLYELGIEEEWREQLIDGWRPTIDLLARHSLRKEKAHRWTSASDWCLSDERCKTFWLGEDEVLQTIEAVGDEAPRDRNLRLAMAALGRSCPNECSSVVEFLQDELKPGGTTLGTAPICKLCRNEVATLDEDACARFFDEVPKVFKFPDWDALREAARIAVSTE